MKAKIKVVNWKKILIRLGISYILLCLMPLFLEAIIDNDAILMMILLPFFIGSFVYWGYLGVGDKFKKKISFEEFKTKNAGYSNDFYVKKLKKCGYNDEEICKILNIKDIDDVGLSSEQIESKIVGFSIGIGVLMCFLIALVVGTISNSFGGGTFLGVISALIILPISNSIGSSIAHKQKMLNILPKILSNIEEKGYSIKNQYISSNGNGVVIDFDKHAVAVITINTEEPLILQSYNILNCEMNIEKAYRINGSDSGINGMLLENNGLKELGKYDSRDITEFYTHIDVNLTIYDGKSSMLLPIPLISKKIVNYLADEQLILANKIVSNIKILMSRSTEDIKQDTKEMYDKTIDNLLEKLEYQTGFEYDRNIANEYIELNGKLDIKEFIIYDAIRPIINEFAHEENSEVNFDKEVVLELSKLCLKMDEEQRRNVEEILNKYIELYNKKYKIDVSKTSTSYLDEIKKLKELLDIDAISKEEYDKKKKELLK